MNILEPLEMVRETQNVNLNAAKTRYKDYNLFIMNLAPLCLKPNFGPEGMQEKQTPGLLIAAMRKSCQKSIHHSIGFFLSGYFVGDSLGGAISGFLHFFIMFILPDSII